MSRPLGLHHDSAHHSPLARPRCDGPREPRRSPWRIARDTDTAPTRLPSRRLAEASAVAVLVGRKFGLNEVPPCPEMCKALAHLWGPARRARMARCDEHADEREDDGRAKLDMESVFVGRVGCPRFVLLLDPPQPPDLNCLRSRRWMPAGRVEWARSCDRVLVEHGTVSGSRAYRERHRARWRARYLIQLLAELELHERWELAEHRRDDCFSWSVQYVGRYRPTSMAPDIGTPRSEFSAKSNGRPTSIRTRSRPS